MTDHDYEAEIDALFAGRPDGQSVTTVAHGRNRMGRAFTITIEQVLPDNAEVQAEGAVVQMELAFHAAFGRSAEHVDPETGEVEPDLSRSIEVTIEGLPDYEAAAETRAWIMEIMQAARKAQEKRGLTELLRSTIPNPDLDDGPSLN